MSTKEPSFTLGIEEEYLLVDRTTRALVAEPPEGLVDECEHAINRAQSGQISPEFLRSQIEIGTKVCANIGEARNELNLLRGVVSKVSARHDLAPIAASIHPFAHWSELTHTKKARYEELARDLQVVGRRLMICGMHVHIGIEDEELRIDIFNQARYFLPHLLALSTSSPFWQGANSGLKSYRLSVFQEMPRTGLPARFESWSEYERTVNVLIKAGVIEDATKIWWDLRPSARFPTLEMRICDVCPLTEDALTIASFFQCICRMLYRIRRSNQRWRSYPVFLLGENRWRAQRHGIDEGLVDFGRGEIIPFDELMSELMEMIREDAEALDCVKEIQHTTEIIKRGTSADRQLARYHALVKAGADNEEALRGVVDSLIKEFRIGISEPA